LNNEGNLEHRLALPARALACYRSAQRTLARTGDRGAAGLIGVNVANCLALLGRTAEARRHYRDAAAAAGRAERPLERLRALYNLAYLAFLEHRHETAP